MRNEWNLKTQSLIEHLILCIHKFVVKTMVVLIAHEDELICNKKNHLKLIKVNSTLKELILFITNNHMSKDI